MEKIYSSISNLWTSNDNSPYSIASSEILKIGNVLNSILSEGNLNSSQKIQTPQIVVVGTQSSGKSSVLNGILSMDLLPTGSTMVTRTPLSLQLTQTKQDFWAEFGEYHQGQWKVTEKIPLQDPQPTEAQMGLIRKQIEEQTIKKAGGGMGISSEEIIIKIYSPHVPNLSLIDLPGLTMVACTDKGQPKDIKQRIRSLIGQYLKAPRCLALAVMAARSDLEADLALDLIKEYDPKGERTIGVITKVDLMNSETDIGAYLENQVSVDLQMKYGYYAVKNRSTAEMTH
tara:strand:- start:36 stop:893 length:858 start_codon:yes stop_codon:yes gene_type:complete